MKLMNVPHIAIIPYMTCNFSCSYCVANKYSKDSLKLWDSKVGDIIKFLNTLDKKMILVSGGEPLLYDWSKLIKETNHYWYFATNASVIPKFLYNAQDKVKLLYAAFHREGIGVNKFIKNILKIQDMGYAIFCKIIYTKDDSQFNDWDLINSAGIPVSFAPLVGVKYTEEEVAKVLPYCISDMYADRFLNPSRKLGNCVAGTSETFEIRATSIVRCGLQDIPLLGNLAPPKFLKRMVHDGLSDAAMKVIYIMSGRKSYFLGDIYNPQFYSKPVICHRKRCDCEWHTFSGIGDDSENPRWQNLIDTGKWV